MKTPEFIETGASSKMENTGWRLVCVHSRILKKVGWFIPINRQSEIVQVLKELTDTYSSGNCTVTSSYRKLYRKKYEVVFEVWQQTT